MKRIIGMLALTVTALAPSLAQAGVFYGNDAGVNRGGSRTQSLAAQASWLSAVGAVTGVIDFESMARGNLAAGRHYDVNGVTGVDLTVQNRRNGYPDIATGNSRITGFSTTAGSGNSKFLKTVNGADLTFHFDVAIKAFGAFFTGLGTSGGVARLQFDDGTYRNFNLDQLIGHSRGGVGFFGYTVSGGTGITSVRLNSTNGGDVWGIDDFQFAAVPEPGAFAIWGLAALGGCIAVRRRRQQQI